MNATTAPPPAENQPIDSLETIVVEVCARWEAKAREVISAENFLWMTRDTSGDIGTRQALAFLLQDSSNRLLDSGDNLHEIQALADDIRKYQVESYHNGLLYKADVARYMIYDLARVWSFARRISGSYNDV